MTFIEGILGLILSIKLKMIQIWACGWGEPKTLGINRRDILKPSKVGDVKIPSVSLCQADDEGSQQEEGEEHWQVEVRQELSQATEAGALLPPQRWRHSGSLALHRKYNEISEVQTQILDPNKFIKK